MEARSPAATFSSHIACHTHGINITSAITCFAANIHNVTTYFSGVGLRRHYGVDCARAKIVQGSGRSQIQTYTVHTQVIFMILTAITHTRYKNPGRGWILRNVLQNLAHFGSGMEIYFCVIHFIALSWPSIASTQHGCFVAPFLRHPSLLHVSSFRLFISPNTRP